MVSIVQHVWCLHRIRRRTHLSEAELGENYIDKDFRLPPGWWVANDIVKQWLDFYLTSIFLPLPLPAFCPLHHCVTIITINSSQGHVIFSIKAFWTTVRTWLDWGGYIGQGWEKEANTNMRQWGGVWTLLPNIRCNFERCPSNHYFQVNFYQDFWMKRNKDRRSPAIWSRWWVGEG